MNKLQFNLKVIFMIFKIVVNRHVISFKTPGVMWSGLNGLLFLRALAAFALLCLDKVNASVGGLS